MQVKTIKKIIFSLLTINDVYKIRPIDGIGGLAALSTLISQQRQKYKNTIFSINGDFLSASQYSSIYKGMHFQI